MTTTTTITMTTTMTTTTTTTTMVQATEPFFASGRELQRYGFSA
jgi:hypothetical protein